MMGVGELSGTHGSDSSSLKYYQLIICLPILRFDAWLILPCLFCSLVDFFVTIHEGATHWPLPLSEAPHTRLIDRLMYLVEVDLILFVFGLNRLQSSCCSLIAIYIGGVSSR